MCTIAYDIGFIKIEIFLFLQDSSISKLTREIEALKKELREKDSQISNMSKTVKHLKEPKTEERDARERELISLRQVSFLLTLYSIDTRFDAKTTDSF